MTDPRLNPAQYRARSDAAPGASRRRPGSVMSPARRRLGLLSAIGVALVIAACNGGSSGDDALRAFERFIDEGGDARTAACFGLDLYEARSTSDLAGAIIGNLPHPPPRVVASEAAEVVDAVGDGDVLGTAQAACVP